MDFLDLCRDHRILVHVTQHRRTYDTANYHDREALVNAGASAEADAEERAETVREGVETARLAGKMLASVPYGYWKDKNAPLATAEVNGSEVKYVPVKTDPAKAAQVLALFTLVDQGHAVAHACRETGISREQARAIMKNLAYIAKRRMEDGTTIDCLWPAIVPEDMFWRVQAILAAIPQSVALRGRPRSTYKSLLGGIAVCGKCSAPVTTQVEEQKERGTVRRYRCSKGCFKIDMSTEYQRLPSGQVRYPSSIDERVGWEVVKYLLTPGVLEQYLPEGDAAAAAAARGEAESMRAELAEWAADLDVSRTAYKAREAKMLPLIEAAEERARQLSIPPAVRGFADRLGFEEDDPETATAERLNAAMQVWYGMPREAARALLREVATVTIYPMAMARELGRDRVEVLFEPVGVTA